MFARALLMIASKIVAHAAFMLIAVVLARSLAQAEFGTFNQVWLFNKALLFLFDLGLPMSVYYFWPRLADRQKKGFILQTLFSLALLAVPFAATMYFLADSVSVQFNNPDLAGHLRLFALYPLVMLPASATEELLLSQGLTGRAAAFESFTKIAMIAAVAAAALLSHRLDWVLRALIGYGTLQLILGIWLVWQPVRHLKARWSVGDWTSQLAYSAPYGFSTLAAVANYQVDKVLVSLFNAPAAFAVYAAGAFEIPIAGVTAVPVVSVMMGDLTRHFAAGNIDEFLALWHRSMRKVALPVFAVTAFLMVFAEPTVTLLFSAKYASSVGPFRFFLLFLPLRITVLDYILASLGKTKAVFAAQLAATATNILLGAFLIRAVGWWGAALSAVLSGYIQSGLLANEIRKQLGIGAVRLMPWLDLVKVGWVAIAAAVACLPVLWLPVGGVWQLAVGGCIYTTIYGVGSLKVGAITMAEIQGLLRWGRNKLKAVWTRGDRQDRLRP
ncbi:oligosaccharide flippase family protein [Altericista sp. CCNU0014]|uniref:oligosaccharide flippase family protein n=1 Tax=Altericista sp. CCNU0014 TaxID=3082949 RepID=UPI003850F353